MKVSSIRFNAVMNTLLTASNMTVSLITVPYVTRVLSVEGYGDVGFAQSVSTWLSALCMLGIGTYGVRECARVRDDLAALARTVRELLAILAVSTAVVCGAFAACIPLVPRLSALAPLMWVFLVGTVLMSFGVEWFYQAIEQYAYITARSVAFKVAALAATFALVRSPGDYLVYGAILSLVTCGNNVLNLVRLRRMVGGVDPGALDVRRHLGPLMSFAALSISSAVYLSFDSTLLGMLSPSNYQVGLYQLSTKLKAVMFSVVNAVLGVLIPRLTYYHANGREEEFLSLLRRGLGLTANATAAIAGYLLAAASPVVVLVSGPDFAAAAAPLRVIGFVNLLSCLSYFIGICVLTPTGRERRLAAANALGVPVSVALNALLDPSLGAMGAALSLLLAELAIFLVQAWSARDVLARIVSAGSLARIALSNALAFAVCSALLSALPSLGPAAGAIGGLAAYAAVDLACLALLGDETLRGAVASIGGRGSARR